MGTDPQRFLLSGIEDEVSFKANLIFPRKRCICRYFNAESSFTYMSLIRVITGLQYAYLSAVLTLHSGITVIQRMDLTRCS